MSKNDPTGSIDARTRRTRTALAQALMRLGGSKSVDDIDVSELVAAADISRSTFYAHFTGMRDFLCTSYSDMLAFSAMRGGAEPDGAGKALATRLILEHVSNAGPFAKNIQQSRERPAMLAAGEARLRIVVENNLRTLAPFLHEAERRAAAKFVAGGFMGMLRSWMEGGMREAPEEIRARFELLTDCVIEGLARRAPAD